jgi:PAS domain S-box-containing protein
LNSESPGPAVITLQPPAVLRYTHRTQLRCLLTDDLRLKRPRPSVGAGSRSPLDSSGLTPRQQLRFSLEAANVGTWNWNISTGEVRWSDNLERIHGQPPGSFQGTFEGFLGGVHVEDREVVLRAIRRARETRENYRVEYRSVCADGREIWLEGRGRVVYDSTGRPVRMLGVCMDVTERKRLEKHLQQTQRLESLGLLAGGIAHDFNNLITGILGNASLALDRLPPADPARHFLQDVIAASHQTAELTRQLLAFAGKGRFVIESLDLATAVPGIVSLVRSSIPPRVELQLDLAPAPIEGDASQIRQLVMNLVINGSEAIGPDRSGTVLIQSHVEEIDEYSAGTTEVPAGKYACLVVRDTGCGMDQATLSRIFEPFFTTKVSGRGLGLAAVLGIVHGHRGMMNVDSTPGLGTTFRVWLPATKMQASVERVPVPEQDLSGSGVILVVDDEEVVRRTAHALLEAHGYTAVVAATGHLALDLLTRSRMLVRAVVLDVSMPEMDGESTLQRVRALWPEIPVIMTSGYTEAEVTRRFQDSGVVSFLQKPYTAAELAGTVAAALKAGGIP